ncbi:MAG: hypothetical protein ACFB2W_26835 [Leptolyngbyaceae cyanobacterium]
MGKPQKPFIAARIPIGLEEALEKHTKATGESKTTALINALGSYVSWSQDEKAKPSSTDRLNLLEERVEKLEKLIQAPQQTSLLELKPVIETDNNTDNKLSEAETDNSDNKVIETGQENIIDVVVNEHKEPDNNTDNIVIKEEKLFTHKEVAEITGIPYNTVKKKPKANKTAEGNDRKFKPIRRGKISKWIEIT